MTVANLDGQSFQDNLPMSLKVFKAAVADVMKGIVANQIEVMYYNITYDTSSSPNEGMFFMFGVHFYSFGGEPQYRKDFRRLRTQLLSGFEDGDFNTALSVWANYYGVSSLYSSSYGDYMSIGRELTITSSHSAFPTHEPGKFNGNKLTGREIFAIVVAAVFFFAIMVFVVVTAFSAPMTGGYSEPSSA
jgi:hypothetical protein